MHLCVDFLLFRDYIHSSRSGTKLVFSATLKLCCFRHVSAWRALLPLFQIWRETCFFTLCCSGTVWWFRFLSSPLSDVCQQLGRYRYIFLHYQNHLHHYPIKWGIRYVHHPPLQLVFFCTIDDELKEYTQEVLTSVWPCRTYAVEGSQIMD